MAQIFGAFRVYLDDAIREALNQLGAEIEARAKAKAPVRKLEKQTRGRTRTKTALNLDVRRYIRFRERQMKTQEERNRFRQQLIYKVKVQKKAPRQGLILGREVEIKTKKLQNTFLKEHVPPVVAFHPRAGGTYSKAYKTFEPSPQMRSGLSARGAYEVRQGLRGRRKGGLGAGFINDRGALQIGGRLKNSIVSSGAVKEGSRYTVSVTADVPYAKYVEFPTRRTAAQPFMLPALKETKRKIRPTIEAELIKRHLKRG